MDGNYKKKDSGRYTNKFLSELERLAGAGEAGEFSFDLNIGGLSGEETKIARLVNTAVEKYRESVEYDLMKYKLANDALNIALWDVDIVDGDPADQNNRFKWSQEFRQMLGFSDERDFPDTLQSWSSRLHPNDRATTFNALAAHLNDRTGKTPYDIEYRLMMKNGRYRNFHAFGTTLRDDAGIPRRTAGAIMDITENKQMAASLEHRAELLNAVNNASKVLLTTAEDGEMFEASLILGMELMGVSVNADHICIMKNENTDAEQYFVYHYGWTGNTGSKGTLIGKGAKFPYGIDARWARRVSQGECLNGSLCNLPLDIRAFFGSINIETKAILVIPLFIQDNFWGIISFSDCGNERVFTDDEINILRSGALMMVSAINRNAQADKVREAHKRIKLLMDAMPYTCHLWNRKFEIFDCNEENIRLFNLKDKREIISGFHKFSPEYQPDGRLSVEVARASIQKAFDEGGCVLEYMHQTSDGIPIPTEITLVRIAYEDDYAVAAYARDLREQKRLQSELEKALEEAREANQAKNAFLANMSHEMRTPLNAVVGLSELILNVGGGFNDELEDKLEKIHTSGLTLLGIVNDILDISKIESGRFEINPVEYDTPSLINDTVTLNIVRIGEKPVTFNLIVDETMPVMVYGDDLRIKQIFNNLLSNAFKYTNSGVVEWRVSYEIEGEGEGEGDNVWIVSSVCDSGIGIKPEDIEKLFSDYNQLDVKTNRKVQGTGLGLAITKRLVAMMDGKITVESEYGCGTTFNVRLRQKLVDASPIGREVAKNLAELHYTVSKRANNAKIVHTNMSYANVLVVDDVATNIDVIKGMLKPYGMRVDCVSGGQQAINLLRAETVRYNAVFMDHMMPDMDGIEATRIIREEIGTDYARTVPIIALTANAIVGNEEMFLREGFQAFISKPIDMMKLDSLLRQWVRDKSLEKYSYALPNVSAANAIDEATVLLCGGITIAGLDIQKGLERFGNNLDTYIKVLRSYAANTSPLISDMAEHIGCGNMRAYAITAHGIKGSSYNIGSNEIGKRAEELEAAAKAGDIEAVKSKHKVFEKKIRTLIDSIKYTLASICAAEDKPAADSPAPELLAELRDACRDYEIGRIKIIMERLESFAYKSGGKTVEWLREQIDEMNIEGICYGDWPNGPSG